MQDCTNVQYTAREYVYRKLYECRDEKRGGEAGFSPPKDKIRLRRGETFRAGPGQLFLL
jgi:hypothetical protein